MGRRLVKRRGQSIATRDGSLALTLIIVIAVGVLVYLTRNRWLPALTPTKTYENAEIWNITYNADGLPTQIVVNRNAKRT